MKKSFFKICFLIGILSVLAISCNKESDPANVEKPEENISQSQSSDENSSSTSDATSGQQQSQQTQTLDTTNPTKTALQPQNGQSENADQPQPQSQSQSQPQVQSQTQGGGQQTPNPQAKNSPTLKHVDGVLGHQFSLDDRVVTFERQGTQYRVVYTVEGENGTSVEKKNLSFNQKSDSLSDGTYTYKVKNNKLGLYGNGGKQLIFVLQ